MDKRIIFAVAGSGKTTYIIKKLTIDKRYLIITYTNNNVENIRKAIIRKFGYFPNNIKLLSYFVFLYSFCYKPILSKKCNTRGINFNRPPRFLKSNSRSYYIDYKNRLYHNRIALLCKFISKDIISRIEKYYDCVCIDEVQDFAGHDFNLLKIIIPDNCETILVGDFHQHTFDTSNDGNINSSLYNDYNKYKKHYEDIGITIDTETLISCHRCSSSVCDFIAQKLGISIFSSQEKTSVVKFIEDEIELNRIIRDNNIIKLFYQNSHKYNCFSMNWGGSKGINDYIDVCVVLNKTTLAAFKADTLNELTSQTKNKLYVACSRANQNLYFIPEDMIKEYKNN